MGRAGDENKFVGTEAVNVPDEVMHKVLSVHPGVQMVNLRAFPYQDAIDLMSYAATLPTADRRPPKARLGQLTPTAVLPGFSK